MREDIVNRKHSGERTGFGLQFVYIPIISTDINYVIIICHRSIIELWTLRMIRRFEPTISYYNMVYNNIHIGTLLELL